MWENRLQDKHLTRRSDWNEKKEQVPYRGQSTLFVTFSKLNTLLLALPAHKFCSLDHSILWEEVIIIFKIWARKQLINQGKGLSVILMLMRENKSLVTCISLCCNSLQVYPEERSNWF